jgi:hypothetical protein
MESLRSPHSWALAIAKKGIWLIYKQRCKLKRNRIPVSTIRTGCIPFNKTQISASGYKVGENPVKENGDFVASYDDALNKLRCMNTAGWRDYGSGNSQSAHKATGWVLEADATILFSEKSKERRVELFQAMTDVVK